MGSNLAYELAEGLLDFDLNTQLEIHLQSNHYPPVPVSMVEPCIEAIDAYYDEDYDRLITQNLEEPSRQFCISYQLSVIRCEFLVHCLLFTKKAPLLPDLLYLLNKI